MKQWIKQLISKIIVVAVLAGTSAFLLKSDVWASGVGGC